MQVIVDQNLVEYQLLGRGETTILLLHGWTDAAQQSLAGLARNLAAKYQLVIPDLPGFGKSPPPPNTWGIPEYGQLIQEFVTKLRIKPDIVIGHSNGGTLALYAASHKLITPNKLILLSSAGIRGTAKARKTALKLAAKPVKLLLSPLPYRTQERIKKRVYGRLGSDLYVMAGMKPIFKRVVEYDAQHDAGQVTVPTLLIYGADDTATPVSFGEVFQRTIPGARLEIVASAGHFVQTDQPDKTLQLIEDFLA